MVVIEVAIICLSFVSCIGIVAGAYYLSEMKKEQMRQYGITQRAQMKMGNEQSGNATIPYQGEWAWIVPIVSKLLEIPAIQQAVIEKVVPSLSQAMIKKE